MPWGGEYSSIGGDIKFMRLMQRQAGGLVTDGAVRDSNALKDYGFPVYSANTTAKQGPAEFWPWQVNDAIQCGGVLVRPGDAVVGDDDGSVVVPSRRGGRCDSNRPRAGRGRRGDQSPVGSRTVLPRQVLSV